MTESSQGSEVSTPSEFDALSREELIELVQAQGEGPIRIQFAGKTVARRLARRVRPRVMEQIKKYSVGTPEEQAASQVICQRSRNSSSLRGCPSRNSPTPSVT